MVPSNRIKRMHLRAEYPVEEQAVNVEWVSDRQGKGNLSKGTWRLQDERISIQGTAFSHTELSLDHELC